MPLIDMTKQGTLIRTSLWYGMYRAGKTRFCATFPRVAWFGSEREGGFETIRWMPPTDFYEPAYPPMTFGVNNPAEMLRDLNTIVMPLVQKGRIRTIVMELSFYSDDMIRERTLGGDNTWAKYGDLEAHVIHVDAMLKKVPGVRVAYNALAGSEDDKKKPGNVVIAGKALSRKMPALCDMIGYMRQEETDGKVDHLIHTTAFGNFPAGHRYGDRLPPLLRNPTFRTLEALLTGKATCDALGNITMGAGLPSLPGLPGLPPLK